MLASKRRRNIILTSLQKNPSENIHGRTATFGRVGRGPKPSAVFPADDFYSAVNVAGQRR